MTSHNIILLASGDIECHTSMGIFPLNIYLRVPGYTTNYPIGHLGNKLPGYGSPNGNIMKGEITLFDNTVIKSSTAGNKMCDSVILCHDQRVLNWGWHSCIINQLLTTLSYDRSTSAPIYALHLGADRHKFLAIWHLRYNTVKWTKNAILSFHQHLMSS